MASKTSSNPVILSTDTLPNYGLDLIFSIAKEAWFDGIDLALRKNFDAWHENYVSKLSEQYELPIQSVQTSRKLNKKELEKAISVCTITWASNILINAPVFFNARSYKFIIQNVTEYQKKLPDIKFSIITPDMRTMAYLPIPKFRFKNFGGTITKYKLKLWFDISVLDEDVIETMILGQGKKIISNIAITYVADRLKDKPYILPGEGNYNLPKILKTLQHNDYTGPYSVKLEFNPKDLVDNDKILFRLQKSVEYIKANT